MYQPYEIIDISEHPSPFDTTLHAARVRWFRWLLKTEEGRRWNIFWDKSQKGRNI